MGNCRNCRHWVTTPRPEPEKKVRPDGWGVCQMADLHAGDVCKFNQTLAFASQMQAYTAWLYTAPEFGCVQYEARPVALRGGI